MTSRPWLEETQEVVPQQTDNGFKPGDGIIKDQGDIALQPPPPDHSNLAGMTAHELVSGAVKHLKTIEQPPGSNRQPFGQAYGWNGVAWCNIFVSEVGHEVTGGYDFLGKFASTSQCATWWHNRGRFGHTPKTGAIVFFDWGGTKHIEAIDHVGIVVEVLANALIRTVEGNSAIPEHPDGVWYHDRNPAKIVGYGYPQYMGGPDPVPAFPGEMHRGSEGSAVRQLQQRLQDRGWHLAIDGHFGPATEIVVCTFQKNKGLKVDGLVGPKTWAALWSEPVT